MKMNKWTIGLAAVGVVSLSSVAQAQDAVGAAAGDAAKATVEINGYVSTSYHINTEGSGAATGYSNENTKQDRFNLDVLDLQFGIKKGSGDWATGFLAEVWIGDQASNLNTDTDGDGVDDDDSIAIKQAYIDLTTPFLGGNKLDLKIGVFDTIIGHEAHNHNANDLYSRSWGFTIEPTTHTGILASYQVSDMLSVKLGLANTVDSRINAAENNADNKTLLAGTTITLPEGWWPWANADNPASIDIGAVVGSEQDNKELSKTSLYGNIGLPLPVGIKMNLVVDLEKHSGDDRRNGTGAENLQREDNMVLGLYLKKDLDFISDKLSAVVRYEFADIPEHMADLGRRTATSAGPPAATSNRHNSGDKIQSFTAGLRYDLWDNVITRLEYRADTGDHLFGDATNNDNMSSSLIMNVIYQF